MQQYIDNIMTTASKLTCIGFDLRDEWIATIMLAGLTDDYKPLIMSLEANSNIPTSDEIKLKLLDTQSGETSGSKAFFGNRKQPDKKKGKRKRKCYICKSDQHLANACDKKTDTKTNFENGDKLNKLVAAS